MWTVSLRSKRHIDVAATGGALAPSAAAVASGYTAYGDRDLVVAALRAALD